MDELKKELSELIDSLANARDNNECCKIMKAIDKSVWLIYITRIKELGLME